MKLDMFARFALGITAFTLVAAVMPAVVAQDQSGGQTQKGSGQDKGSAQHKGSGHEKGSGQHKGSAQHKGSGQEKGSSQSATDSASTKAFKEANDRMHQDMAIAFSGDADTDFIKGMIPHHKGAVDMARIVLEHGKDPEVRKLADAIIKAQEDEISWMNAWLAKSGKSK